MNIENSIALVTGANRGLGKALVAALVEAGATKVYAAARDPRSISASPLVVPLTLDTTQPEHIAAAVKQAGDVTLVINNAGVCNSFDVLTSTAADLEADFRTNVYGTLAMIRAFVPVLRAGSTIVNVLSLGALANVPSFGGYAASKAAAYSITQALRPALAAKHIAILAALPGPIDTDMVKARDMPKASAAEVARGVLAGIARGDEDIYPDPLALQLAPLWSSDPKAFERAMGAM